jgi:serine protease Do
MCRRNLLLLFLGAFSLLPSAARGQDRPPLDRALAYEQALHSAIERAESSVVCILISRSDVYSKRFHDDPPADNPGRLGDFKAGRRPASLLPAEKGRPVDSGAILKKSRQEAQEYELEVQKHDLADPRTIPQDFASGVIIDGRQLLILTTYQAVHDATKLYVRLPGRKGSYADIYAADPRSDLAVLRLIDAGQGPLPEIQFGDANHVRKGDLVVTLANPFAAGFREGGASAAAGIISNIHQRAAPAAGEVEPPPGRRGGAAPERRLFMLATLLQTDVRLNVDCSGGAVVNLNGELIGLTTARAALPGNETAGGFAIPFDDRLRRIVDKLKAGLEVEYGFLGVTSPLRADKDVIDPIPGSPAQKAQLAHGDRIVAVNGKRVTNQDELFYEVATLLAGTRVRLTFVRDGQAPAVAEATLTKSYVPGKIIAANRPAAVRGMRVDYTSVFFQALPVVRGFPNGRLNQIVDGVYISELQEDSPATRADPPLRVYNIITDVKIGGVDLPVHTPADFYRLAAKLLASEPLELKLAGSDIRDTSAYVVIH